MDALLKRAAAGQLKAGPNSGVPTLLEVAGIARRENAYSDMLAFFFDSNAPHGLGSLCLEALLGCLPDPHRARRALVTGPTVLVNREVGTEKQGRIDLVVETPSHIVAIENKIDHDVSNDFEDYAECVATNCGGRVDAKILLVLHPQESPGSGFEVVTHEALTQAIRSRLEAVGSPSPDGAPSAKYFVLLQDLLDTVDKMTRLADTDLEFVQSEWQGLEAVSRRLMPYEQDLAAKIGKLRSEVVFKHPRLRRAYLRGPDPDEPLTQALVHDLVAADASVAVAVDARIDARGWRIVCFVRRGPTHAAELLRKAGLDFEIDDETSQHYALRPKVKLAYRAEIGVVRGVLTNALERLAATLDTR
ncbi:MAG: PD-(D/E)XK nuclease family protein [Polyangiaceae bacterium]|nr:PD-(D/E)XK nuclease family protein [Polyangiaceae bacterium]